MLYYLHEFTEWFSPLRIFKYISVRTFAGAGSAFLVSLLVGPWLIDKLTRLKIGQQIQEDEVLSDHRKKANTPTMGGVLIIFSALLGTLLWARPGNSHVFVALATLCYMGTVGFWDDYLTIKHYNTKGLGVFWRLGLQSLWALMLVLYFWNDPAMHDFIQQLYLPFLKEPVVSAMGFGGTLAFVVLVIAGSSNAVNLTDGLDGLAIGCSNAAVLAYLVMVYASGHAVFAEYLQIPHMEGGGELTVFCGSMLGAGLGFLWYNCHPAKIFMGDTGSLAIGGSIGVVAILIKQELVLLIVGGVFIVEALSVIIQCGWFKYTKHRYGAGRRVFLCSPLHHHFEQWEKLSAERENRAPQNIESRIVTRFCIMAIIFALLGIATLKIR